MLNLTQPRGLSLPHTGIIGIKGAWRYKDLEKKFLRTEGS